MDHIPHLTAPFLDEMVDHLKNHPRISDPSLRKKIIELFSCIDEIEAQGEDDLKELWIKVPRGCIRDFGELEDYFEPDGIETREDFVDLWRAEYPEQHCWYLISFISHSGQFFIGINRQVIMEIVDHEFHPVSFRAPGPLIDLLRKETKIIVDRLRLDENGYNLSIEEAIPYSKRYGRILRSDYWNIDPKNMELIKGDLTDRDLKDLEEIVGSSQKKVPDKLLTKMTAGIFFEYCRLAYHANGYLNGIDPETPSRDVYKRFADGRDCGLCEIEMDSEEQFLDWHLHRSHCGGHPWEIARGGNSTHISMYVCRENEGWYLRLAGSSRVRVNETVKMSLALFRKGIPLNLVKGDEISRMVNGSDFIGIVPDFIMPVYCNSSFPEEEKIHDFMNLWYEESEKVIEKAFWYPLEKVKLKKKPHI